MHKILMKIFPDNPIEKLDYSMNMDNYRIEPFGSIKKYPIKDCFIFDDKFKHPVFLGFITFVETEIEKMNNQPIFQNYMSNKKLLDTKKHKNHKVYTMEIFYKQKTIRFDVNYIVPFASGHRYDEDSLSFKATATFDYDLNQIERMVTCAYDESDGFFNAFLMYRYESAIMSYFGSLDNFFNDYLEQNIEILETIL